MSKYDLLKRFLDVIPQGTFNKDLSFSEIEKVLGFKLPKSAYEYREWWANPSSAKDHPHAQSWLKAGWKVESVSLSEKLVYFIRK